MKKIFFNTYKKKIFHIVFENFFKNHLIKDRQVAANRIVVIPHPIMDIKEIGCKINYDCVGLCNSNSEEFIDEMCSVFLKDKSRRILLRSKSNKTSTNSVEIISGFLEASVYYRYINESSMVLVPVPESYKYRLSGSIYDALSRRKVVLTTSSYYAESYSQLYPGTCVYVSSAKDVQKVLDKNTYNEQQLKDSFDLFIKDHKKENIAVIMHTEINKVLEE